MPLGKRKNSDDRESRQADRRQYRIDKIAAEGIAAATKELIEESEDIIHDKETIPQTEKLSTNSLFT